MSGEDNIEGVVAPPVYDYSDWSDFYWSAMRYHETMHPDKHLISDRIETLRKFMSKEVITALGSFIRPHPRYHTTEGWDTWLSQVTGILEPHDDSVKSFVTLDIILQRFKNREISELQLWDGLDRLAVLGEISSAEQREWFWNSLSWDAQVRLTDEYPYVDPHHEVWTSDEPVALAEQKLSQYMEYIKVERKFVVKERSVFWSTILAVCILVPFIVSLVQTIKAGGETPWVMGLVLAPAAASGALTCALIMLSELRGLRKVRHSLRPVTQKGSLLAVQDFKPDS